VVNEVEVDEALFSEDETFRIEGEGEEDGEREDGAVGELGAVEDLCIDDDLVEAALLIDKDEVAFVFDLTRVGTNKK
jgi:hypothetical protein